MNIEMFETDNIYGALQPIFFISSLFGHCSFKASRNGFSQTYMHLVYPICLVTIYSIAAVYDLLTRRRKESVLTYAIIELVQIISAIIFVITTVITEIFHRKQMIHIIDRLSTFDREMKTSFAMSNLPQIYKRMKRDSVIASIALWLVSQIVLILDLIVFFPDHSIIDVKGNITYCSPIYASNFLSLQLSAIILSMRARFRWINIEADTLRKTWNDYMAKLTPELTDLKDVTDNWNSIYFQNKILNQLESLRGKYTLLQTLMKDLNSVFSLRILVLVNLMFFTILSYVLFFIVEQSEADHRKRNDFYSIKVLVVLIVAIIKLGGLCSFSAMLYKEAKATVGILHGFQNACILEIDDYIEHFSNQILLGNIELSACNMFSLDIPLIFSVSRGIASYLIICIQFNYS